LDGDAARTLLGNGCIAVVKGANMPCTAGAARAFGSRNMLRARQGVECRRGRHLGAGDEPDSARLHRDGEDLRKALRRIMEDIHAACVQHGEGEGGRVGYVKGANLAGRKLAGAMLAFGVG
jgi:glutamate dehydrogenase (NADP+)